MWPLDNVFHQTYKKRLMDLSSSHSGAVFGEWDYNEGLKIGVISYLISRCKCYGPNKTNFMDFHQKLLILDFISFLVPS